MPLTKLLQRLEYLDRLIRFKNTGTPTELAEKLGVSERTLYRMLEELRIDWKLPIAYDQDNQTYCYLEEGKLVIGFQRKLSFDEMARIKGGVSFSTFHKNLTQLTAHGSEPSYLCTVKKIYHI